MFNIVNSILFRLKKIPVFWIMLGICVILPIFSVLLNVGANEMLKDILGGLEGMEGTDLEDLTGIQTDFLTAGGALVTVDASLSILVTIAVAIVIGNEFSFGTIRNAVLSNKSRTEVYFAYAIVSAFIVVSLTAVYMLITYVSYAIAFGLMGHKIGAILASVFVSFGLVVLSNLFVAALTLFFVVLSQKKSSGIVFPLLICQILPGLILIIIAISMMTGNTSMETVGWYPLINCYFYDGANLDGLYAMKLCLTSVALIATFGGFGYLIMKNKDLT